MVFESSRSRRCKRSMLRIVPKEFWRNASVLLLWRWWYAGRSASWRGSDNWLASSDPVYKQMRNCIGLKILMRDEGLQMVGRYLFIIIEDIITPLVLWLLSTDVWLIRVVLAPPGETLFTLLVQYEQQIEDCTNCEKQIQKMVGCGWNKKWWAVAFSFFIMSLW